MTGPAKIKTEPRAKLPDSGTTTTVLKLVRTTFAQEF